MIFQNNTNIYEEIKFISKMMFDILKIPVYFLDESNNLIISFEQKYNNNPLSNNKEIFTKLFLNENSCNFPIIKSTKCLENYFSINLKINNNFLGKFVVGPSVFSPVNEETINKIILVNNIQLNYKINLIKFYSSLKEMDYLLLVNASLLFYYCIYNKMLQPSTVIEKNSSIKNLEQKIKNSNDKIFLENRQNTLFHHSLQYEKNIFKCIQKGDSEGLLSCINANPQGKPGMLSINPLRNKKNLVICVITLATRAAMDGGLDAELAYSLSDAYIQNLERIESIPEIENLKNKALFAFADKVHKLREFKYPKNIFLCQNYISKHLYDDITLSHISNFLGLSKKYLSSLFSKSMGITLTEYIQKQKIEEAKFLLTSTNYSIIAICEFLKFHDQSHFTKIFKKFTGLTPKKYKDSPTL
ncbi:helix-turn-helix domain-containing protein [Clostridium hydrogenum]|uniref:helix-turn-helix domain-containing protein n=1 Tax=Clostridium hydrogenum TaxID=2855764 RepID=UPI001F28E0AB|nr:helix-turn-helix domain-containing protein [Clostridium hydrogenum]